MSDPFEGLPRKHFGAIVADPPWTFKVHTAKGEGRTPQMHYACMTASDICALPVASLAANNCHLFMWCTAPHLTLGLEVLEAWGFKYSSIAFTWVKLKRSHNPNQLRLVATIDSDLHVGLGFTTRKNAEFCLLGRRGSPKRIDKGVREIILAPVREHSRKPDETYHRVEAYCAGPYLDLFSRQSRSGWSSWGNEVGKFDEVAA